MKARVAHHLRQWMVFPLLMVLVTAYVDNATDAGAGGSTTVAYQPPVELCPIGDTLSMSLNVSESRVDIPVVDRNITSQPMFNGITLPNGTVNYNWSPVSKQLRVYHLDGREEGTGWQLCNGSILGNQSLIPMIPGPTLRLAKGSSGMPATKLNINLINGLPPQEDGMACNNATNYFNYLRPNPMGLSCSSFTDVTQDSFPPLAQTPPSCFHGDNVTNLHFHGLHTSPQPPHDYVLLALWPNGSNVEADTKCMANSTCNQIGKYTYSLNPISDNQAPGTHWYHPHKHGSTALQVLNGMAGAILIEGEFDQQLRAGLSWKNDSQPRPGGFRRDLPRRDGDVVQLKESVLVVQEIDQYLNFYISDDNQVLYPAGKATCVETVPSSDNCSCTVATVWQFPVPLVNGQFSPMISMDPGEIQRWRFVGATMQATAQIVIMADERLEFRQIAQDGVQFSPENYRKQPLLRVLNSSTTRSASQYQAPGAFLGPGNRADFLVRLRHNVTRGQVLSVYAPRFGGFGHQARRRLGGIGQTGNITEPIGLGPSLVSVQASHDPLPGTMCFPGENETPDGNQCLNDQPHPFPPMSPFFETITPDPDSAVKPPFNVVFGMSTAPNDPAANFTINGVQYCPECANFTLPLDVSQSWRVQALMGNRTFNFAANATTQEPAITQVPNHPFHIHTNPFLLTSLRGMYQVDFVNTILPFCVDEVFDPPIWFDTISLPGAFNKPQPGDLPAMHCAGRSEAFTSGHAEILMKPIDFTGAYVTHCHFLGHEDRGMMLNVQSVCGTQEGQQLYGEPRSSGGSDDCRFNLPSMKSCANMYETGDFCAANAIPAMIFPPIQ